MTAELTNAEALTLYLPAWESSLRETVTLAGDFTPAQWALPTRCPGWTVQDQVAHLASFELLLLGGTLGPAIADRPYLRNDFGRALEGPIEQRRGLPGAQVLAELAGVVERRVAQHAAGEIPPDRELPGPSGRVMPYGQYMGVRAFDVYAHEQDIRAAVDRPGDLDSLAARLSRDRILQGLPRSVAKQAGLGPGTSVGLVVSGAVGCEVTVRVDADARAHLERGLREDARVTVEMDFPAFLARACGRTGAADTPVTVTGDREVAAAVLANLAMTP